MDNHRRRTAQHAAILFAVALAVRMMIALSLPHNDAVFWDQPYWEYARNFAHDHEFWMPNPYGPEIGLQRVYAFRPPLFPFLWGCIYNLTGGSYLPLRAAFAVLGAASCALAYLIGLEMTGRRSVAFLGGLLCAFYPPLVWHSVHLMTEPLFIFLSTLCIYAAFVLRRSAQTRWAVAAGVAAGLAALTRSMMIGFLPFLAFWVWWTRRRSLPAGAGGRAWLHAAVFCGAALMTMSPWIIRNAIVFRAFVPATTDAGHGFYVANNPRALANPSGFSTPKDWSFLLKPGETSVGELEASRRLMRITAEYLVSHPGEAARLIARRFVTLWRFYPHPEFVRPNYVIIYAISYIPLFPFILFGLWLVHRHSGEFLADLVLVDALILYTAGAYTIFLAMMRYREPLMPYLLLFAALGLLTAWEFILERIRR